ncbi:MAG TPA: hypothetical protein VNK04_05190 [Gemmataceae bacterium]|nr:hypothetical protein [Gemmataceae bacterium]
MGTSAFAPRLLVLRRGTGNVRMGPETARYVCGLAKYEAEELLDWLEANGRPECEVSYVPESGFMIRLSPV